MEKGNRIIDGFKTEGMNLSYLFVPSWTVPLSAFYLSVFIFCAGYIIKC